MEHREILDRIAEVNVLIEERKREGPHLTIPTEEDILPLKYKPGHEVVDKVTGEKGVVIGGSITSVEVPEAKEAGS